MSAPQIITSGGFRISRKPGAVIAVGHNHLKQMYEDACLHYANALRVTRTSEKVHNKSANPVIALAAAADPSASSETGVGSSPGAGPAGNAGGEDGDGDGDGDDDGDGPRRPRHRNRSLPTCTAPCAHRRLILPTPLTRGACAWLLALALLLAYVAPPAFATLFVQLGQLELAREMLRYKPVLLLPTPPGWSTPSGATESTSDPLAGGHSSQANALTMPADRPTHTRPKQRQVRAESARPACTRSNNTCVSLQTKCNLRLPRSR